MAICWRTDDGPTLNAGLVYSFVIFQWIRTSIAINCLLYTRVRQPEYTGVLLSAQFYMFLAAILAYSEYSKMINQVCPRSILEMYKENITSLASKKI